MAYVLQKIVLPPAESTMKVVNLSKYFNLDPKYY